MFGEKKERLKQAKGSKKLSFQVTKKTAIIIIISLIINDKISPFICSCVKLVFCLQYCMNFVLSDPMTLTKDSKKDVLKLIKDRKIDIVISNV